MNVKLAVLMSTYNGEKYLNTQIQSILNQKLYKNMELTLYIRDDGSTDHTLDIIKYYSSNFENVVCVNKENSINLGAGKSFLNLLKTVYEFDGGIKYFAFADQDDLWLKEKLFHAIDKIKDSNNERGVLYYSNKYIVDENLNMIREEQIDYYGDFLEILCYSMAYGCTFVFDNKLAGYALLHSPQIDCYHDAWVYRLAKCIGSDIIFDKTSYIYYRQHENNAWGAENSKAHRNVLYMATHFFSGMIRQRTHGPQRFIKEIAMAYNDMIDPGVKNYISAVINYTSDFKEKKFLLTIPELKKRPPLIHLVWVYRFLFNKI